MQPERMSRDSVSLTAVTSSSACTLEQYAAWRGNTAGLKARCLGYWHGQLLALIAAHAGNRVFNQGMRPTSCAREW